MAVIVLLCLGLALPVSRSPHIYLERETGSLPQGDQGGGFPDRAGRSRQRGLSQPPGLPDPGLLFPARRFGHTLAAIPGSKASRQPIFTWWLTEFYGENIDTVLNTTDLAGQPGLTPPQLLRQFEGAAVYQLEIQP